MPNCNVAELDIVIPNSRYELEMFLEVATNRNEILLKRKISSGFFDDICR